MFIFFLDFLRHIIARAKYLLHEFIKIGSGRNITWLLIFAALGPFVFQAASQAIQPFQSQYDIFRDAISSLVFGPYGWVQTGAFYLFGVSLIVLAVSLVFKFRVKFNPGTMLLALAGIGFILIGFNQAQVPGAPVSFSSSVHQNSALAVVLLFPLACFFLAPMLQKRGYSLLFYYTIFAGTFALAFFFIGGQFLVSQMSYVGFYERVMLWNAEIWIEIVCVFLLINSFKSNNRQDALSLKS